MAEINQSASASAEANLVKCSGNTVNFNQAPSNIVSGPTGIAKLVRMIAPVWYEKREARALSVRANSLAETAQRLKEQFPVMNDRRAVMEALGYRMTNEQADNVCEVLSGAQEIVGGSDGVDDPVAPEIRDLIVEGSKGAYDDFVRDMWKRLVSGVVRTPGSFSKRTVSALADMDSDDAMAFQTLCSFCVWGINGGKRTDDILVVMESENGSINGGAMTFSDRDSLVSLGLLSSGTLKSATIKPGESRDVASSDRIFTITNTSDEEKEIYFSPSLTKQGLELSQICSEAIGTAEGLSTSLRRMLDEQELTLEKESHHLRVEFSNESPREADIA